MDVPPHRPHVSGTGDEQTNRADNNTRVHPSYEVSFSSISDARATQPRVQRREPKIPQVVPDPPDRDGRGPDIQYIDVAYGSEAHEEYKSRPSSQEYDRLDKPPILYLDELLDGPGLPPRGSISHASYSRDLRPEPPPRGSVSHAGHSRDLRPGGWGFTDRFMRDALDEQRA